MERNLEFERNYHFNPNIDYKEELQRFYSAVKSHDSETRDSLLRMHGGLIALHGKYQYQMELLGLVNPRVYTVEEILRRNKIEQESKN